MIETFDKLSEERKIFLELKQKISLDERLKANIQFNYYYYLTVFHCYTYNEINILDATLCLKGFIGKEENLSNQIAVVNNTYEMATMIPDELLIEILCGKISPMLNITNDAARLGAIFALVYKFHGISKLDLLKKTLLYA